MSLFFDLFRHDARIHYLDEGAFLFREGELADGNMYVLVSGQMSISVGDVVVEHAGAGAIVGEMALVEQRETRSATVKADTRCGLAVIDEKRFHYLITEAPTFAIEVMRVMANRLRKVDQTLLYNGSIGYLPWRAAGAEEPAGQVLS